MLERERRGGAVERRVELEQRFVDRAEFLGAEVAEVDGAADAAVLDGRERADRGEQVLVGELRVGERADRVARTRGSCRAAGARARAAVAVERGHDELELLVAVVLAAARRRVASVAQMGG